MNLLVDLLAPALQISPILQLGATFQHSGTSVILISPSATTLEIVVGLINGSKRALLGKVWRTPPWSLALSLANLQHGPLFGCFRRRERLRHTKTIVLLSSSLPNSCDFEQMGDRLFQTP